MSANAPADEVKLYFFGAPLIQRRGDFVPVDRQKAIALLAYLALTGRKHRRDVLANLLWPELDQPRARAGLRRVLRTLRTAIGPALVMADQETIGLRTRNWLWSDVIDFQQRLADARVHTSPGGLDATGKLLLEEAVALYRADLLAGFNLRDAPDFENWLCLERESLRRAVTSALEMLVRLHMAQGDHGPALDFAQRWLALEPGDEQAHQAVIALHLRSGDLAAARRQYEVCTRVLAEELDALPSEETQLLLTGIDAKPAPHPAHSPAAVAAHLPVGETRLATVLVAGLGPVDEDELAPGAAAEGFIERQERCLKTVRDVLRRYGGYIPPGFGDKLVAIFGIPASHEDDPERAVRAALEVQRCAGSPVATGVHTGMVYLPDVAAALGTETTILGSAIDIALRLYAAAEAGETLVTAATQRLTLGAVAYNARDARLPGARASTTIYSATGLQAVSRKVRGIGGLAAPLVGRDPEITRLLAAAKRLPQEGAGCLVYIFGSPGVGKSRLVAELHDRLLVESSAAEGTEVTWLEGHCTELTHETAYAPFREILRSLAQFSPDDDEDAKARHFVTQLAALWQQAGLPASQLDETGPFLGNLLSLHLAYDNVTVGALAAEEIHHRTVEAIVALVRAIGSRTPSVLVIEDLQWADAHSLVVVERLAARLAWLPVALICVARPQADTVHALHLAARACPQQCAITMHLAELSPPESRQLVEQLLHLPSTPPALESLVLARTEGNPFFIEETLRALMDGGILIRQDGSWSIDESRLRQATSKAVEHVPEAVQSVILSREVAFLGCIDGASLVFGRGCLPTDAVTLRIERSGSHVAAYCSADGCTWHTIGSVPLAGSPCLAGPYAIGLIDRTIYPGAHPQGACIRFSELSLLPAHTPAIPASLNV